MMHKTIKYPTKLLLAILSIPLISIFIKTNIIYNFLNPILSSTNAHITLLTPLAADSHDPTMVNSESVNPAFNS